MYPSHSSLMVAPRITVSGAGGMTHHAHGHSTPHRVVRFVETAIRGDEVPWKAHPEWFERYDFVVRRPPPPSSSTEPATSESGTVTLLEHVKPDDAGVGNKGLNSLPHPHRAMFFTHFHWVDAEGAPQTVTREELINTFDAVVEAFEQAFAAYLDAHLVLLQPRAQKLNHIPAYKRVYDIAVDLRRRVSLLHELAVGFGEYLSFLSDAETMGDIPHKWHRHPGPITATTLLTSPLHLRPVWYAAVSEGTVSDYAFRVAALLQGDETLPGTEEWEELAERGKEAVEQLTLEVGLKPPEETDGRKRRTLPSNASRYRRQWEIGWGHWTMW